MSLFSYRALDAAGKAQQGVLEVATSAAAAEVLHAKGWTPLEITTGASSRARVGRSSWKLRTQRVRTDELAALTDQLATLLVAGQPLDRALTVLHDAGGRPLLLSAVGNVRDAVRSGSSLSDALAAHPGVFPALYVAMVKAGEAGGMLPAVLRRLAEHLLRSAEFRRSVINALIYPAILLCTVLLSLGFLMAYVVPQFAEMYANLDAQLPWFSRLVLGFGQFLRDGWMLLFGVVFAMLLLFNAWLKRPASREAIQRALLRRRFIGPLLGKIEAERYLRTLGTLLASGVSMTTALRIARAVLANQVFVVAAKQAEDAVRSGERLSEALARESRFPALPLQMARIGEEAGELDAMLLKASDVLAAEVRTRLDRVLAALVPAVTVLMFLLIGVVVMSILVPLYDLTSVIG